ncbi:hypothetical protein FLACOL7796_04603 [Flavobacterium collinsii]|uniref:Uncharacterized protein n=1 Tax=Flavobacterium collinsii TaxID=1114861 RepID=A0ABM8KRX5_9FLAO|nr:hypothetical protein FLACOL7796_04603 [Flavobacterium collinsii]
MTVWRPLQTVFVAATPIGVALTVTFTTKLLPEQDPEVGVTVYGTIILAFVILFKVLVIFVALVPEVIPVIPATTGADQLYVVPEGIIFPPPLVGVTTKLFPEQIVEACVVVILGFGLTVIVTVKLVPIQLPDAGATL